MADPSPEQHRGSHAYNVAVLVLGAGLLTWMLHQLGWHQLHAVAADVGRTFVLVLALDLVAILCDARGLHTFMRPEARMVSYGRVVAAHLSGRAVNVVTPFAALGEATKATMLVTRAPRVRVASAIVLFNLAGLYLSVTMIAIGTPITLLVSDLPHALEVTALVGLAVVLALVIALGVMIRRGATATLLAALQRARVISPARRADWQARLVELDRQLAGLHELRRTGAWRGALWILGARLVTWTATMTLIHAVGVPITPRLVLGVLSIGVLIGWISSIVPFGLGLADGGNYALFDLLGASGAHGAFVTMMNRVRSLAVALVGFAVMAVVHTMNRMALARQRGRIARGRGD